MTIDPTKLRELHEAAHSKSLHPEDVAAARFALKQFVMSERFLTLLAEHAAMKAELARRDANETRNCINWGPCSAHDGRMSEISHDAT